MSHDQSDHFAAPQNAAPLVPLEEVPHHVREVAALRGLGFSFREIGRTYGVTPQAVSIMLSRQRALMKSIRRTTDLAGLSPRAVNALGRIGCKSRDAARQDTLLGEKLIGLRNCGRKTIQEVIDWASSPPLQP